MTDDEFCECGKPLIHLSAPEDSKDWGCLVPDFDKQTGAIKRHTPQRSIRIAEPLWKAAQSAAAEQGETVTDVITEALRRYVKRNAR